MKQGDSRTFYQTEIDLHCSSDDCWVVVDGIVYDVTSFLKEHPGGSELILSRGGKEVSALMEDDSNHCHSANAYKLLSNYKIGRINEKENDCNNNVLYDKERLDISGWNEDLVDWNKGMVRQVHKFGKDYLKWVHSPVNKKLRLFDSDFIEVFSKTPWYAVPVIWLPIATYLAFISYKQIQETSPDSFYRAEFVGLAWSLLGLPGWSFLEYMLHRYLFHLEPTEKFPFTITLHFFLHGQHHKVPFDNMRLVFPPVAAVCIAFPVWYLIEMIFPGGYGGCLTAGLIYGYIFYDLLHYYLHHGEPTRGGYLHSLKYYHVLHHFDDHNTGFGISSKFWDYPFSTVNKRLKDHAC